MHAQEEQFCNKHEATEEIMESHPKYVTATNIVTAGVRFYTYAATTYTKEGDTIYKQGSL